MTDTNTTDKTHWIEKHLKEMFAGEDVVIVTIGSGKAKLLLRHIHEIAGEAVKIREHVCEAVFRSERPGSIRFATIPAMQLETVFLATSVALDEDIATGGFSMMQSK